MAEAQNWGNRPTVIFRSQSSRGGRVHRMRRDNNRFFAFASICVLSAALMAAAFQAASPATLPTVPAEQKSELPRVLVFSKTASFRHDSIPDGIQCLRELLSKKFTIDATEDASVFTPTNLARYKVIVFLSTTGNILDTQQEAALEGYIHAGGGFAGIHAAADTEHEWPWYGKLVGAYFLTHPKPQTATVIVESKLHPSSTMLPDRWTRFDEWYVYKDNPRARVQVIAALDDSTIDGANMGGDHPIAWYQEFEGGRSWYTGGGHTKESYAEPLFREHLDGGIRWAAGEAKITLAPAKSAP